MELIIFTSPDAGRSAMAAAFFNELVVPSIACAIAAIPDPQVPIDPVVVTSFKDLNLARALRPPARFTQELGVWAAEIIHVGSTSASYKIGGIRTLEWDIADPRRQPLEEVNAIRDWIRHCVEAHLREKEWLHEGAG